MADNADSVTVRFNMTVSPDALERVLAELGVLGVDFDVQAVSEIDRLAAFLLRWFPDEIGRGDPQNGESAVDVAIRLLHENA
jgi:hypothetical protein